MSYRDDLAALEARATALRSELAQTESLASEARALVRQRVLEAQLATPCTALWADMQGDDRVRHCKQCKKNVYNFSELSRDEIDAVIVKTEGRLCGRMFVRADGTILTKDCTRDIRLGPSRLKAGIALTLAAAALAGGGYAASQFAAGPPDAVTGIMAVEEMSGNMQIVDEPVDLEAGVVGESYESAQGQVTFPSQDHPTFPSQ